jgi:hypothetical protein
MHLEDRTFLLLIVAVPGVLVDPLAVLRAVLWATILAIVFAP